MAKGFDVRQSSSDSDHQPNGSQPENREPEYITEEKGCINNFLDHYELFFEQIELRGFAGDRLPLYAAYLTQRRDAI